MAASLIALYPEVFAEYNLSRVERGLLPITIEEMARLDAEAIKAATARERNNEYTTIALKQPKTDDSDAEQG